MPEISVQVTVINIDKVIARVKNRQYIKDGLQEAGKFMIKKAQEYPPTRTRKVGKHLTAAQKRAIRWKVKMGFIRVPYQRGVGVESRNFHRAWALNTQNSGLKVVAINNTHYGKYVMGDNTTQSKYHKGNWKTLHQLRLKYRPEVMAIIEKHVAKDITRAGA